MAESPQTPDGSYNIPGVQHVHIPDLFGRVATEVKAEAVKVETAVKADVVKVEAEVAKVEAEVAKVAEVVPAA